MEKRVYGKTGKEITLLGFGSMRFENPKDIDGSVETVLHAWNKGINYFDTAPMYCEDKSEIIVGQAIREMKKSGRPFFISTKSSGKNPSHIRRDLEKSLTRLNLDTIDFFHCWCVLTMADWQERKSGGAVNEILKARDEGLIRHAVVSTHLPGHEIRQVVEEGYFEGITMGYCAINMPYREEGIQAAAENNMGVVIMNPLGGGLIPVNEEVFSFLKMKPEQPIVEAALQFLKLNPNITSCIVGFRNKSDVDSAFEAMENGIPYTQEKAEMVRDRLNRDFNSLCTTCGYCDVCPQGIEVWKFMETANLLFLNPHEKPSDRLYWHWGKNINELDLCTACGECEEACTQHLPILERFEQLKEKVK